ncbi:MAG: putative toxin-antitoxin system toxin component, PIN family [Bryobacteraceae bacterium]|nr:putative toxin-antitoxin system toxin component, PIN family [Bryobacteraceae bacterium]
MRIAVNTAILIRATSKATGPARELLQAIQDSGSQLILSPYVLAEAERVLRYPGIQRLYNLSDGAIWTYIRDLESYADIVEPAQGPPIVLKDANDDPVLYTAVAGQADILCTRAA